MTSDVKFGGLYQPIFLKGLFLVVLSWSLVGLISGGGIETYAESAFGFLLAALASLTVFVFWKLFRGDGWVLLVVSYLIYLLIFPLAWVVILKAFTYICLSLIHI